MPTIIYTPRINNNDDTVRLASVLVELRTPIRAGDPIIDVETDKATFTVEAEKDGFLLAVNGQQGDTLDVGSILAWIGETADEKVEQLEKQAVTMNGDGAEPTLKALLLLKQYGLRAAEVPFSGPRLTATDVVEFANKRGKTSGSGRSEREKTASAIPAEPGKLVAYTSEERGMLRTVTWHRDEAAAGYVELPFDPAPWDAYAAEFQKREGLLMSPLLALMCWRLAQLAKENPRLNGTAMETGRFEYEHVNLGFTVQSGASLYMVVVRNAEAKSESEFAKEMGALQRAAMKNDLKPEQIGGATVAFSSMARWKISRHVPILPPQTSLMIAHTATHFGATYDHRALTGFDAASVLLKMANPAS